MDLDPASGGKFEAPVPGDGGHHKRKFHPGKGLADALPRTAAEGDIRKPWACGAALGGPTLGHKALGVRVKPFVAVQQIRAHDENGVGGNYVRRAYESP